MFADIGVKLLRNPLSRDWYTAMAASIPGRLAQSTKEDVVKNLDAWVTLAYPQLCEMYNKTQGRGDIYQMLGAEPDNIDLQAAKLAYRQLQKTTAPDKYPMPTRPTALPGNLQALLPFASMEDIWASVKKVATTNASILNSGYQTLKDENDTLPANGWSMDDIISNIFGARYDAQSQTPPPSPSADFYTRTGMPRAKTKKRRRVILSDSEEQDDGSGSDGGGGDGGGVAAGDGNDSDGGSDGGGAAGGAGGTEDGYTGNGNFADKRKRKRPSFSSGSEADDDEDGFAEDVGAINSDDARRADAEFFGGKPKHKRKRRASPTSQTKSKRQRASGTNNSSSTNKKTNAGKRKRKDVPPGEPMSPPPPVRAPAVQTVVVRVAMDSLWNGAEVDIIYQHQAAEGLPVESRAVTYMLPRRTAPDSYVLLQNAHGRAIAKGLWETVRLHVQVKNANSMYGYRLKPGDPLTLQYVCVITLSEYLFGAAQYQFPLPDGQLTYCRLMPCPDPSLPCVYPNNGFCSERRSGDLEIFFVLNTVPPCKTTETLWKAAMPLLSGISNAAEAGVVMEHLKQAQMDVHMLRNT